jgi:UDP-N-acetylmuramyl tripeptide synthase
MSPDRRYRAAMLRLRCAVSVARVAQFASRLIGRGGTALPGLIALRIDPAVIEKLVASIPDGVVVVTGTNGKTTTSKMIATMLAGSGRTVLANPTGSNLARGVAAALVGAARRGTVVADIAVFEIDEAAVRHLGPRLRPRVIVVTNLARDQLDRYGELETTARHVAAAVAASGVAVLAADDPIVARLGEGRGTGAVWFGGVPAIRAAMPDDRALYGHGGPRFDGHPDAVLHETTPDGDGQVIRIDIDSREVTARLQVPGVYNAYNAAAALLTVAQLGIDPIAAAPHLAEMPAAFGRGQIVEYRDRRVRVVLVKNPAGLNQAIELLRAEADACPVLVAINDNHADGRDVSWLWDAAVETLADTPHRFGAGGIRAADMALRFKYAGIEAWMETDDRRALDRLVDDAPSGATVYLIPTYTALLSYLEILLPGKRPEEVWS